MESIEEDIDMFDEEYPLDTMRGIVKEKLREMWENATINEVTRLFVLTHSWWIFLPEYVI